MPHPFTMCKRFEPRVGDIYCYVGDINIGEERGQILLSYVRHIGITIPNNFRPRAHYRTNTIKRVFLKVYRMSESRVSLRAIDRPGNNIEYSSKALKALTNRGVINLTLFCKKYQLDLENTLAMLQSEDNELQSLACGMIEGSIVGKWNKSKPKIYGRNV